MDFSISRRFYRVLLRLYPIAFRTAHGSEMEEVYVASLRVQLARWGPLGFPVTWIRIVWDTIWHAVSLRRRRRVGQRDHFLRSAVRSLGEDAWFAARHVRRHRSFTAAVVGTLALGIGLTAAVFGATYSLLFRPLPGVEEPDALVQIYRTRGTGAEFLPSSIPLFRDLQADNDVFSGVAAWTLAPLVVRVSDRPERVVSQVVSSRFFQVLGVRITLGRGFTATDRNEAFGRREVVLSERFWRSHFGADPAAVGRTLEINGTTWEIVGVAPPRFRGPLPIVTPALWAPLSRHPELLRGSDQSDERGNNFLELIARLKPGVGVDQAAQWLDHFMVRLGREHPGQYERTSLRLSPQPDTGPHPALRTTALGFSGVILGVAGLLLLIACVNVAGLLLAKAEVRRKEVAAGVRGTPVSRAGS